MSKPVLYGFDGSAFVRSVKMLLAEKGTEYEQVPVDLLKGEHREPEHLARSPFGKVPVLDHDGMRLYETDAIQRYLDKVLPGPSFIPADAKDEARMSMAIGLIDSFGYAAMVGGVTAYHLFPDFVGGVSEEARQNAMGQSKLALSELMKIKGSDPYIAGANVSLGDFHVAPSVAYVAMTPDADQVFAVEGFEAWWEQMKTRPSFPMAHP